MTVNTRTLVKMAEDITANLSYTDDEEVVASKIADHLSRFWDPRMKEAIISYASTKESELTDPLRLAITKLAD